MLGGRFWVFWVKTQFAVWVSTIKIPHPAFSKKIILHMFVSLWADWILWTFFILRKWKSSQNAFSSRIVRLFFLFSDYFMPIASEVHRVHPIQTYFDVNSIVASRFKSRMALSMIFFLVGRLFPIKCFKLKIQQNDDCQIALQLIIAWAKDYSKVVIDGKG